MKRKNVSPPPYSIHEYFSTEPRINQLQWKERFSLGSLHNDYVAQGIYAHNDVVYHTVHKKDAESVLIIFKKNDPSFKVIKEIVLPPEATHTSDLTLYKGHFYAIDYHSNYIYQFDFDELQYHLHLRLIRKVRVTKDALQFGSLEILEHKGIEYLLVTSFIKTNHLFVFDFKKFFDDRLGFEESLIFSMESSYFTQGLAVSHDYTKLFHSVNRFGIDFIFELDVAMLIESKQYRRSIVRSFLAPHTMVEDVSVQDNTIYTSDEATNTLYEADLSSATMLTDYKPNDLSNVPYRNKLMSHRARVWNFEENTLDSVIEVLNTNVKYIELDVRFSSDDVPYIYHDSFFVHGEETFRFAEKTWAEIEQYRYAHNNIRITTLEEVLAHFAEHRKPDQILALDIKDAGVEKLVLAILKKYNVVAHIILFTWTPQIIFAFDALFEQEGVRIPLFFSHVRVDSMFKYLLIPSLLNYRRFFLGVKDFVLIGNSNYKQPLKKYERGYRHVPYFAKLPQDLVDILLKNNGGVCVTKKSYRWGDRLLKKYKAQGLKIAIFGAVFGLFPIDTKAKFEYEAQKDYVDIVFMDDLSKMPNALGKE